MFEQHDDVIKEQIKIFITVAFIWKIPCPFWASLDATSSEKSSKKKNHSVGIHVEYHPKGLWATYHILSQCKHITVYHVLHARHLAHII